MNTNEKGKAFEDNVYNYFKQLINKRYFGFDSTRTKIHKQYSAYSKDRENYIIFDIAIECFTPDQPAPFITIFIECKNYEKTVPVDDIEEFSNKLQQVNQHSVKGIVVTKKGFQKSALTISKNRKIALWRIVENQEHDIIFNRTRNRNINNESDLYDALTLENYSDINNGTIYIHTPLRLTTYPKDLIYDFLKVSEIDPSLHLKNESQKNVVPYLSKSALSKIANKKFETSNNQLPLNLDEVINSLSFTLKYSSEVKNEKIIAEVNFNKKDITIFNSDNLSAEQIRFAKAHEIAHIILKHNKFFEVETLKEDNLTDIKFTKDIKINIDRIEFQANYLASCILMPESTLIAAVYNYTIKNDLKLRGKALLYIDNQPCNFEHYRKFIIPLAEYFKVSQEALKIKLVELKLVKFNMNQVDVNKINKRTNTLSWLHEASIN